MEYEKLLDQAYKKVKKVESKERFEIPRVESNVQGNKTIIKNFSQIASHLHREMENIEKFYEKSLAAKGKIQKGRLALIKKIPNSKLQEVLEEYVKKYVLCMECKKPDTKIEPHTEYQTIKCLACGAKHTMAKI